MNNTGRTPEQSNHDMIKTTENTDEVARKADETAFRERYTRQTGLPEIGPEGQKRLRAARVLLVGAGGLGAPISLYLTGAGVGHLGIVDDDRVGASNLHRQILYTEAEVGLPKAEQAARRLRALNSDTEVTAYVCRLTKDNAADIINHYDLVIDGCDNYETRYLLSDVTAAAGKPYVYGAVHGFEGQAAVFNTCPAPVTYRDLYPSQPPAPTDKSIVGMLPGVVGCVLAHEALKIICGYGPTLAGRLWTIDLRTMQSLTLDL